MTSRVQARGPWAHGVRLKPYKVGRIRSGRGSTACPRCKGRVRGPLGEAKVCISCTVQLTLW